MRVTFPDRAPWVAEWEPPFIVVGTVTTLEVEPRKKRKKKKAKAPLGFRPPTKRHA